MHIYKCRYQKPGKSILPEGYTKETFLIDLLDEDISASLQKNEGIVENEEVVITTKNHYSITYTISDNTYHLEDIPFRKFIITITVYFIIMDP